MANQISYHPKSYLHNTEFNKFYLDVAKLPDLTDVGGTYITVPPECENRPDLLSYQQYGTSRLWWVIALANADLIKDPLWDLKSGMRLFIPSKSILYERGAGV